MPKIPDCDRCLLYDRFPHIVCAVHPNGVYGKSCIDFRLRPDLEPKNKELWHPHQASYNDDEPLLKKPRLTPEQQLWLLDNHPFFTGHCPQCGYAVEPFNLSIVHWDCPECGWQDDVIRYQNQG